MSFPDTFKVSEILLLYLLTISLLSPWLSAPWQDPRLISSVENGFLLTAFSKLPFFKQPFIPGRYLGELYFLQSSSLDKNQVFSGLSDTTCCSPVLSPDPSQAFHFSNTLS